MAVYGSGRRQLVGKKRSSELLPKAALESDSLEVIEEGAGKSQSEM